MNLDVDDNYTDKKELFEEMNIHFHEEHNLPPLASKIYSTLILSGDEPKTFEEIIELTGACKSSVSNQLNFLLEEDRIDFHYGNNKRKRFFKIKRDYLSKTLEVHLEKIQKEIAVLSKVINYKTSQNLDKKLVDIFKTHLENEKDNTIDTINNLNQISYNLQNHEK